MEEIKNGYDFIETLSGKRMLFVRGKHKTKSSTTIEWKIVDFVLFFQYFTTEVV